MGETKATIESYEAAFADLSARDHAVAFAYARHALGSIVRALGLEPEDEVILSPLTCKVVPLALLDAGVRPVYADIPKDGLNLDAESAKRVWTKKTRAIIFQYTYGTCAGIEAVARLAHEKNVPLIEDCAQCPPRLSTEGDPGTYGAAAIWSLNLRKPLAAGAGAFATTNDDLLAKKIRADREGKSERGMIARWLWKIEARVHRTLLTPERYWFFFGLSQKLRGTYRSHSVAEAIRSEIKAAPVRMSPFQAQWGTEALETVDHKNEFRKHIGDIYRRAIVLFEHVRTVTTRKDEVLYYFPVFVADKKDLLAGAREAKLEIIAWPIGLPIYPIESISELGAYGYVMGTCPHAERAARHLVGLPLDTMVSPDHVNAITDFIKTHDIGPMHV